MEVNKKKQHDTVCKMSKIRLEIANIIASYFLILLLLYDVPVVGTCVYDFGMKQGELCRRDSDCETGLMCAEIPGRETKSCQPPTTSNKLYSALTRVSYSRKL